MTSRENLLIRLLLILTLGWSYWEYLYKPAQNEISELRDEVAKIEEKMILIANIDLPTARKLDDIVEKFGFNKDGKYYIVNGHNKTLEFLKEMAMSGYRVNYILWEKGKAKVGIILQ
jgi:hypothetical protein